MRLAVGLLSCLLGGCSMLHRAPLEPEKTPEEWFSDRWVGQSEDDVLLQYGKPNDVLPLSNGNHVNSYKRETPVSSSRGELGAYGNIASGSARSDSTTVYCERRFEIGKTTLKVIRAVIIGSQCDYEQ